ncbi:hypothetical protein [Rhizobium sp. NRK18]|uniref:hypothetical protein n=1 Tax=Rhizobium sp. NRK18 TaxID=2964667 RepID=UPI0021C3F510|nr:hypothetical protein [Rhizobium sp. NRK18]MCQ2004938.1 hypothetical protein [Rhizobium sp. NRK18]
MSAASDKAEAAILRLQAKFSGRRDPMAVWVSDTLAALEKRLEAVTDERQKAEARRAGLAFIRATLEEWAKKPPHSSR